MPEGITVECAKTDPHPALAPFRLLLDQVTANAVQAARAERADHHDETRQAHHAIAAVWTQAAHLLQQTIKQVDGLRQPDNDSVPRHAINALADRYAAEAAEQDCNAAASTIDEVRRIQWGLAAGWRHAEGLLRHTLAGLDNPRTTPDKSVGSGDAEAAVARARALHLPAEGLGYNCDADGSYGYIAQACSACGTLDEYAVRWPCPTIQALDGLMEGRP